MLALMKSHKGSFMQGFQSFEVVSLPVKRRNRVFKHAPHTMLQRNRKKLGDGGIHLIRCLTFLLIDPSQTIQPVRSFGVAKRQRHRQVQPFKLRHRLGPCCADRAMGQGSPNQHHTVSFRAHQLLQALQGIGISEVKLMHSHFGLSIIKVFLNNRHHLETELVTRPAQICSSTAKLNNKTFIKA